MKQSEFDKHIQQNANFNLSAPSDLDWEMMDIELPKQRSKKVWLWLPILLIGVLGGIWGSLNYQSQSDTLKSDKTIESSNEVSKDKKLGFDSVENSIAESVVSKSLERVDENNRTKEGRNKWDLNEKFDTQKPIIESTIRTDNFDIKNGIQILNENKNIVKTPESITIKANEDLEDNTANQVAIKGNKHIPIAYNPENKVIKSLLALPMENILKQEIQFNTNILPSTSTSSLTKGWTILTRFNFTTNQFNTSNSDYLNLLNDTDEGAWGQSLTIRRAILGDLGFVAGFSFDRLHTALSFSKDLGVEQTINAQGNLVSTSRTRVVYQNNYANILALNLGFEKEISITGRLGLKGYLGVHPGYLFNQSGKYLSESELIEDLEGTNKFSLSFATDWHLVYNMSNVQLFLGGGYSKFVVNTYPEQVGSTLTNKPNVFFIDLGFKTKF